MKDEVKINKHIKKIKSLKVIKKFYIIYHEIY